REIKSRRHWRNVHSENQQRCPSDGNGQIWLQLSLAKRASAYVGLGKPQPRKIVSLEIIWPSGPQESLANIHPKQFLTVTEGKGITSSQPIPFAQPHS